MTLDKIIAGLKDIVRDRKSFLNGDAEHDEVFQDDIAALEAAIQMIERQKWISVKDRLPDDSNCYLICWRDDYAKWWAGVAYLAYNNISGEFKNEKTEPVFFTFDEKKNIQQYEKVEYWMPLPEPPEESEVESDG